MDEKKLKDILSNMDAPEPDINAKKRAVNLAMAEFLAQQKKNENNSQGLSFLSRLIGKTPNKTRRETMEQKTKKKIFYGGMATAMAVVLIAGTTLMQTQEMSSGIIEDDTIQSKTAESGDTVYTGNNFSSIAQNVNGSRISIGPILDWFGSKEKKSEQRAPTFKVVQMGTPPNVVEKSSKPSYGDADDAFSAEISQQADRAAKPELEAIQSDMVQHSLSKQKRAASPPLAQAEGFVGQNQIIQPVPTLADDRAQREIRNEKFPEFTMNSFKTVQEDPVSTFSVDVDTTSYSFVRQQLKQGRMPNPQMVRIEEMVNYFDYSYPTPEDASVPFKASVNITDSPWAQGRKLMHVGIKGYEMSGPKPKSNLVFLLDVSGSMNRTNKLPLVKSAMKMLIETLNPDDTIAIAVYAGAAGTVLEPTPVSEKSKIINALDNLRAGGSTAGAAGINLAYQLAEQNFTDDGVNRVILATDGDFNVGINNKDKLKTFIETKRDKGIFLSVLGFGLGNYNDQIMQTLAQNGNGVAAYINDLSEAQKVLVDEASSTLFTIAKDVKLQVEFNPDTVAEYRLIGYETRHLNREDFNNDKVDAGDIGAGHKVTAIYEFTPVGSEAVSIDPLRYGSKEEGTKTTIKTEANDSTFDQEYAFLKIRYKLPQEDTSKLITTPISTKDDAAAQVANCGPDALCIDDTSDDVKFSIAVAGFAELLKGGKYQSTFTYDQVIDMAQNAKGDDKFGYRTEFIKLVRLAKTLSGNAQ